ncbi:MAG TPA: oligogalacturonate lyase family protein [Opitutaceae bacterium]|nr:oligogalacturonate lyase family protein [Opitutaceae bacterium]
MKSLLRLLPALAGLLPARAALPSWVDPDTGHRVVQLSADPSVESLYFTQYAFTAGGSKMVMTVPRTGNIDVVTLATGENEHVYTEGRARVVQTGRKTGAIYYVKGGYLYALDPATKQSRQLVKVPDNGGIAAINCDETLAAGTITLNDHISKDSIRRKEGAAPKILPGGIEQGDIPSQVDKHAMMDRRLAARLPCSLFTIDLRTGAVKILVQGTDWLNHQQFSPTDPGLLIYAHEGRQWKVDRVWLIRADRDGAKPMLVHQRTMRMEIAVHEFWSNDGQWVWYDLQTPLSEDFWVGGYNVKDGRRVWYHLPGGLWMVHYNVSPDGTLFSGDGSDPQIHYAQSKDAKWMFLLRPELIPDQPGETPDQAHMIQAGRFVPEKLVNLAKHDYSLEPNGMFSPDGKWVIFRSNFRGPIGVFAVEVAKAK